MNTFLQVKLKLPLTKIYCFQSDNRFQ